MTQARLIAICQDTKNTTSGGVIFSVWSFLSVSGHDSGSLPALLPRSALERIQSAAKEELASLHPEAESVCFLRGSLASEDHPNTVPRSFFEELASLSLEDA